MGLGVQKTSLLYLVCIVQIVIKAKILTNEKNVHWAEFQNIWQMH